jgi:hypothetical protein
MRRGVTCQPQFGPAGRASCDGPHRAAQSCVGVDKCLSITYLRATTRGSPLCQAPGCPAAAMRRQVTANCEVRLPLILLWSGARRRHNRCLSALYEQYLAVSARWNTCHPCAWPGCGCRGCRSYRARPHAPRTSSTTRYFNCNIHHLLLAPIRRLIARTKAPRCDPRRAAEPTGTCPRPCAGD